MKRYPGLDLLRAVAILWVMLFHAGTEGLGSPARTVGRLGWMGVDLFFVLSGYLIGSQLLKSYSLGKSPQLGSFYLRRAFRILPTYWVVLICYFSFPTLRESPGIQPAWQFLTFTENLLVDYHHNKAFSHAWSLCVEEHFYLFFPVLISVLMYRPSWKLTAVVCSAVFFGGMALRAYVWIHYLNANEASFRRDGAFVELIYYPTYMRLDGLLAGVILAAIRWFRPEVWDKAMDNAYWLLIVGSCSLGCAIWALTTRNSFEASVFGFPIISVSFALIVAACVSSRCVLGRFRIPGAQAVATITFSLYLSHKMTWHVVKMYIPQFVSEAGFQSFVVYTLSAVLVGTFLYWAVERPFLRIRDRLESNRAG